MSSLRFSFRSRRTLDAVFSDAIDPDAAVLDLHLVGDVTQAIFIFAEVPRDLGNVGDVMDVVNVDGHAARAEVAEARRPIPGQKLVNPMGRMRCDASEDIGQSGLRIYAVHLLCDQTLHGCGVSPSAVRSAEPPGFPSKSNTSQAPFGDIVGETHASRREARPSLQDIVERLGQVVTARQFLASGSRM
ncbi:hypothetical protein XI04_08690 [Bradyrhizobium sp. CCBAU 11430]|nr:hypothetical protein [Bradyrhizobium sp. CCBAU 11430]